VDDWPTLPQLARELGIAESTARRWASAVCTSIHTPFRTSICTSFRTSSRLEKGLVVSGIADLTWFPL